MRDQQSVHFKAIEYLKPVEAYVPGLRVDEVVERYGIPAEKVVKLASAENPLGPSPLALEAINLGLRDLSLYPDWRVQSLRKAIATYENIKTEQVIVGCGETELMSLIVRAFSEQGEEILFPIPTFPIYEQVALVERRQPIAVAMDENFNIDPERLLLAVTNKTKVLMLTSPNNPLSTVIDRETLKFILDKVPQDILVLLDEAYVDYSESGTQADLIPLYPNLVVLHTFSKIYGLAGLRVGYGIGHEVIIEALMKTKPAWNIGNLASVGASAALEDRDHYEKTRTLIKEGRDYLLKGLSDFSSISVVMNPQANFICLRILDPAITSTDVFEGLLQGGVITKDCSVSFRGLHNRFIRVDVNLKPKMDRFIEQLEKVLS
ncbi:MAG: histidinol-phosphate transaminase [Desulfobacteraceae bacterium]|nr:histidinol-phosphate transaminase [Desulfobacteraceae bacterium]